MRPTAGQHLVLSRAAREGWAEVSDLHDLADKSVVSRLSARGLLRRVYRITPKGLEALNAMNQKIFQPMLSGEAPSVNLLRFPVLASPKLDGIRAYVRNGELLTRNGKLVPNANVRVMFESPFLEGMDGELIAGSPTAPDVFRNTTSVVMSRSADASTVYFYVFDRFEPVASGQPFRVRLEEARVRCNRAAGVVLVPHKLVRTPRELELMEEETVSKGYEGLMLRDPEGPYKFGRSTVREGWLLKWKRFEDAEAKIVGFVEEQKNTNEATKDAFGRTERSSHKANKVGKGTLGALTVKALNGVYQGKTFNVGTGFTAEERKRLWEEGDANLHKVIKFKYFPLGSKDAPRFPTFLGFRED